MELDMKDSGKIIYKMEELHYLLYNGLMENKKWNGFFKL